MAEKYKSFNWYDNGKVNWFKFSEFGRDLNNNGKHLELIEIYESLVNVEFNQYCKDIYAWALFRASNEKGISYDQQYEYIIKILANCEQKPFGNEYKTPYVMSIINFIKRMKRDEKINDYRVFKLLNKLNSDILSTEHKERISKDGKDYISVSSQEFYYTMMIKTLIKLEKYETAISLAELALEKNLKWHYKNDLWIKSRLLYSRCRLGNNFDEDITEFINFSLIQNRWYFYAKISDLLYRQNRIDMSIEYAAKAIVTGTSNDKELLVKVYFNLALMIKNINSDIAKKLFTLTYNIRKKNYWSIDHSLKFHIKNYQINENERINFKKIQKELLIYSKSSKGVINTIKFEQKFGFIKSSDGKSYYFKINKNNSKKVKKNVEVYFDIYHDKIKRKHSAINLIFKEE